MDLIKDRLAHIIRAKNLTATQFAEMMQIQPSNVSHLLSGRNKPSLDFLIKLKDLFPEYSFDWIILGKKPITISERNVSDKNENQQQLEIVLNDENESYKEPENIENKTIIDESVLSPEESDSKSSKCVKQIIYVYEDHTFEIYELKKNRF